MSDPTPMQVLGGIMLFLLAWLAFCGSIVAIALNGDKITVFVLRLIGAPVYRRARMLAALIYEHPEEWTADQFRMEHPKIGKIWIANKASGVHVEGEFGRWDPGLIERRIIWNAVQYHRNRAIEQKLGAALRSTP